ncbi:MAG TPA: ATP-binding protein, partial [Blastocatellia bacterium]
TTLTQKLLTFSKGGAPIKKAASVAELVKESAEFALAGSNVKCDIQVPDNLFPAEIDEGQIYNVLHNLVLNAREAMPAGGTVSIKAENLDRLPEGVLNPEAQPHRCVRIAVSDKGPGIPKENLKKIFDPYFTTKSTGTGLGLATAYSIVKAHNGNLSVESTPQGGTTFFIDLPATDKSPLKDGTAEQDNPKLKGRILVMEDEEMVRDFARRAIDTLGFEVETASNAPEAIRLYKEAKEQGRRFDAVILDLTIPGGMGGKEAIKHLHEIDPEVRAIVSSGYSDETVMAEFQEYGFAAALPKPYDLGEMEKVLRHVMFNRD